ncbi:hypothetical protein N658DRAFT_187037 [Parathielavia hyrcaniae]|uniref:Uncharacterized protein n=1 Tax=Parathielavia hyrcaniae TaxID=113614 RepID=A0AAN6Q6W8_9PEZI|nr:hypothetical protein N658DRAFT_187037 [Parathielavia hyrcaniae]
MAAINPLFRPSCLKGMLDENQLELDHPIVSAKLSVSEGNIVCTRNNSPAPHVLDTGGREVRLAAACLTARWEKKEKGSKQAGQREHAASRGYLTAPSREPEISYLHFKLAARERSPSSALGSLCGHAAGNLASLAGPDLPLAATRPLADRRDQADA